MSERAWSIVLVIAAAVIGAVVQALFRGKAEQGRRIGKLESEHDFQRGYRAGYEARAQEERRRQETRGG